MSIVVNCTNRDLTITDIYRLISAVSPTGDMYIRVYDDGTDPDTLTDLADCESGDLTILDILRGILVTNDDGEFALNIATLS